MCTEAEKVVLATYHLQGIASTWWRTTNGIVFPEGVVPKWNAFVEVFNGTYFSDNAREMKTIEFQCLRQGTMTMDQYEAKFAKLSRYTPELVQNLVGRARRFRVGLRPEVRSSMVPLNLKDYNDLYERAQLIKRDQNKQTATSGSRFGSNKDGNQFGKRPMVGGRYPVLPNRKGGIGKLAPRQNGVCRFCGSQHGTTPCPSRMAACYECGQQGHIAKNCPKRPMGQQ
ncbi:hypothetical protein ACJRO7_014945 [Eucalyptus globulus]|uniref:CCHC-type domain-containing protein n=1 Tax=Eucalyptus globulus TaxID=34317 RepID=A0ABD3L7S8_EUCGL